MTTHQSLPDHVPAGASSRAGVPPAVAALLDTELSMPSRLGHVCLLIAASLMTVAIGSLWATEPVLPVRTQWAFGAMVVVGLSWAGFASWVLRRRRPLLAHDRVVAGWMSVAFTSVFVLGALFLALSAGGRGPVAAAASGATLLIAAVVTLVRARQEHDRLSARRAVLEQRLHPR